MENTTMKNIKFLSLILCIASFFGLQAMSPDSGPYYGNVRKKEEKRIFLFDEEHAVLLKKQVNQERDKALRKQIENEILEEFKKLNASVHHNNLSDDEFENNEKEAIRCAEAYKIYKENKSLDKPAEKNIADPLLHETNNHFAALCIKIKQERHTESPIAQFVTAGKESPFSETTTPSLSPTPLEKEYSDTENTYGEEDNMFAME
jgi:hypothetical protein